MKIEMLTGDSERTAQAVAKELGLDRVQAGVTPADKHAHTTELAPRG